MKRQLWFLLLISAASTALAGQPHKEIDLRKRSDSDGEYSISLCARPSPGLGNLPGHAFVMYSHLPASGQRKILSVGFTTDSTVKGVLSFSSILATPQGYLEEEKYTSVKEQCLVLLVNRPDFEKALAQAQPFAAIPQMASLTYTSIYSLTANDCVTFMTRVASQFQQHSIVLPPRKTTDLPLYYLRKLIEAN